MNFKEDKISLITQLDFNKLNQEEINQFSFDAKKNPILPDIVKKKILISFLLIFLIRTGNFIQIPGIDKSIFFDLTKSNLFLSSISNNLFTSNSIPGLFYLGIGPSINASIIIQLFIAISPDLKKFQREEGEFAKKKISQYIRYLTLLLAIIQSCFLIFSLRSSFLNWNFEIAFQACSLLTTGAMIVLWISEKITKNGITNGASLLVFLNVLINIPKQIQTSLLSINFFQFLLLVITLIITTGGVIILQQSVRCIPIMTSKLSMQNTGTKTYKQKTFFPIKLNQAGVMPIVFASYFLQILKSFSLFIFFKINNFFQLSIVFPNFLIQFLYFITEFLLICLFTNFYSLIIIDPKDMCENLQKSAFFIPGIRPGKQTLGYLEGLFSRQSLLGGLILASNVVFLNIISSLIKLPISQGIGIGSQIIIIGVIVEIVQKIRSLVISESYKKYLKSKNN
jgi:preprotein translocase subunit SecY